MKAVQDWDIRAVVTFDAYGVSGHANHRDTHAGVLRWAEASQVDCWVLVRSRTGRPLWQPLTPLRTQESPGWPGKFSGALFVLMYAFAAWCRGARCACLFSARAGLARNALREHRSQAVWFRSLFVFFATCAYANTLRAAHRRKGALKKAL